MKQKIFICIVAILLMISAICLFQTYRQWSLKKIKEEIINEDITELEKICKLPLANVNGRNPWDYFISVLEGVPEPRPMYVALRKNNVEIVKILIKNGVDLTYRPPFQKSYYLDYAISWGENEIVELLLENEAPLNSGYGSLANLLRNRQTENSFYQIWDMLIKNNVLDETEFDKLLRGVGIYTSSDVLEVLLVQNPELVNYQFSDGESLMSLAITSSKDLEKMTKFIQILLSYKFDLSIKNSLGKSAYDLAIEYGYNDIAALVMKIE